MIAVSFYDALARENDAAASVDTRRSDTLVLLAKRYVESALGDWQGVMECERQFSSTVFPTPADQSRVNRSLYEVHQKWAGEAEQVLLRTRRLARSGHAVDNAEALEDTFGRVPARLQMTPEMFDRQGSRSVRVKVSRQRSFAMDFAPEFAPDAQSLN